MLRRVCKSSFSGHPTLGFISVRRLRVRDAGVPVWPWLLLPRSHIKLHLMEGVGTLELQGLGTIGGVVSLGREGLKQGGVSEDLRSQLEPGLSPNSQCGSQDSE